MSTVTIVNQDAPYQENNKAWHALRFAGASLAEDMEVQVHLLDDGVLVGKKIIQFLKEKRTSRNCFLNLSNVVWKYVPVVWPSMIVDL